MVPKKNRRRVSAPKPPMGTVAAYRHVLRKYLLEIETAFLDVLLEGWETNPVPFGLGGARFDASDYVTRKMAWVDLALEERFDPGSLAPDLERFSKRVDKKTGTEFRRVIGISSQDTGVKSLLNTFQDANVDLIKSLVGGQLTSIRTILEEAEVGAWRVEELRQKIKDSFGVTKSKADLLARDQVLKLNGQLTRTRQTNAGIDRYIWTTAGDERVRKAHSVLDGTVQSWDKPPVISEDGRTGHPGDDYQCRCTAFPLLDELDGEEGVE